MTIVSAEAVTSRKGEPAAPTSTRATALAERLMQGAEALATLASTLTAAEWEMRIPHDGRTIGVVANQPKQLGGILEICIDNDHRISRRVIHSGRDRGLVTAIALTFGSFCFARNRLWGRPELLIVLAAEDAQHNPRPLLNLADRGYVFSVATLEPRKNLDRLLAAHQGLPPACRARRRPFATRSR